LSRTPLSRHRVSPPPNARHSSAAAAALRALNLRGTRIVATVCRNGLFAVIASPKGAQLISAKPTHAGLIFQPYQVRFTLEVPVDDVSDRAVRGGGIDQGEMKRQLRRAVFPRWVFLEIVPEQSLQVFVVL